MDVQTSNFWAANRGIHTGLPLYDSDFGLRVYRRTLYKDAIGDRKSPTQYIVERPLEMAVYRNDYGFTAILSEFDAIFGYGDNEDEAIAEVKSHLHHLRQTYDLLTEDKGTAGAMLLRQKLRDFLREVPTGK